MDDLWLDEKKVSRITGRAVQSLRNDRFRGVGFPYVKVGRSVRYRLGDVMAWMENHTVTPGAASHAAGADR